MILNFFPELHEVNQIANSEYQLGNCRISGKKGESPVEDAQS